MPKPPLTLHEQINALTPLARVKLASWLLGRIQKEAGRPFMEKHFGVFYPTGEPYLSEADAKEYVAQEMRGLAHLDPVSDPARVDGAAKGGKATAKTSLAKATALATLHAQRRGVPVNDSGVSARDLASLLADLQHFLDAHATAAEGGGNENPNSKRSCARDVGISDKTLRRYLRGELMPPAPTVQKLLAWLRARK